MEDPTSEEAKSDPEAEVHTATTSVPPGQTAEEASQAFEDEIAEREMRQSDADLAVLKSTISHSHPPAQDSPAWRYAKAQGASDEDAAKYVLDEAARLREEAEDARPKRHVSTAVLRIGETVYQPGTDISALFSREELAKFLNDGHAELK